MMGGGRQPPPIRLQLDFPRLMTQQQRASELPQGDRCVSEVRCVRKRNWPRKWASKPSSGAEMFIFRLRQAHSGGPSHDKVMRAIRLFGEKVMPQLA